MRNVFRLVSRLGDGVFWYSLMAVLLVQHGSGAVRPVVHMALVGLLATVFYKVIKRKTLRPRPFSVYPAIVCTGKTLDQFSFPSGHTMHAVSFSIIAACYFPWLIWLVAPFAVLVGLSRPILGLHYPSDVLAGAALGAAIAFGSLALC
ncbi:MAG: phosphatase PAP2 family protein [Hyphomicrobiaceae bacterium]